MNDSLKEPYKYLFVEQLGNKSNEQLPSLKFGTHYFPERLIKQLEENQDQKIDGSDLETLFSLCGISSYECERIDNDEIKAKYVYNTQKNTMSVQHNSTDVLIDNEKNERFKFFFPLEFPEKAEVVSNDMGFGVFGVFQMRNNQWFFNNGMNTLNCCDFLKAIGLIGSISSIKQYLNRILPEDSRTFDSLICGSPSVCYLNTPSGIVFFLYIPDDQSYMHPLFYQITVYTYRLFKSFCHSVMILPSNNIPYNMPKSFYSYSSPEFQDPLLLLGSANHDDTGIYGHGDLLCLVKQVILKKNELMFSNIDEFNSWLLFFTDIIPLKIRIEQEGDHLISGTFLKRFVFPQNPSLFADSNYSKPTINKIKYDNNGNITITIPDKGKYQGNENDFRNYIFYKVSKAENTTLFASSHQYLYNYVYAQLNDIPVNLQLKNSWVDDTVLTCAFQDVNNKRLYIGKLSENQNVSSLDNCEKIDGSRIGDIQSITKKKDEFFFISKNGDNIYKLYYYSWGQDPSEISIDLLGKSYECLFGNPNDELCISSIQETNGVVIIYKFIENEMKLNMIHSIIVPINSLRENYNSLIPQYFDSTKVYFVMANIRSGRNRYHSYSMYKWNLIINEPMESKIFELPVIYHSRPYGVYVYNSKPSIICYSSHENRSNEIPEEEYIKNQISVYQDSLVKYGLGSICECLNSTYPKQVIELNIIISSSAYYHLIEKMISRIPLPPNMAIPVNIYPKIDSNDLQNCFYEKAFASYIVKFNSACACDFSPIENYIDKNSVSVFEQSIIKSFNKLFNISDLNKVYNQKAIGVCMIDFNNGSSLLSAITGIPFYPYEGAYINIGARLEKTPDSMVSIFGFHVCLTDGYKEFITPIVSFYLKIFHLVIINYKEEKDGSIFQINEEDSPFDESYISGRLKVSGDRVIHVLPGTQNSNANQYNNAIIDNGNCISMASYILGRSSIKEAMKSEIKTLDMIYDVAYAKALTKSLYLTPGNDGEEEE